MKVKLFIATLSTILITHSGHTLATETDQTQKYNWLTPVTKNNGFIEDSHFKIIARNWFELEEFRQGSGKTFRHKDGSVHELGYAKTWVQSARFIYESGFTQGTIGFGIDLAPYTAIKLDAGDGHGRNNIGVINRNSDGTPTRNTWTKMGIYNLKFKARNTIVKAGQHTINNPFLTPHDNKSLPSSFHGVSAISKDITNLQIQAGSFNRVSPRYSSATTRTKLHLGYSPAITFDRFSFVGFDWTPMNDLTINLYGAQAKNTYRQYFFGLEKSFGNIETAKWTFAFVDYLTKDHKSSANVGDIDNNIWSTKISVQHQAHKFAIAYQQVDSDSYFDYLRETSSRIHNSMFMEFNGPNEKSLHLNYSIDTTYYGLPNLNLMFWAIKGWGLDGTHYKGPINHAYYNGIRQLHGAKHREFGINAIYKIPHGKFKDTMFRVVYMNHRGSSIQKDPKKDTFRIITEVPINIL